MPIAVSAHGPQIQITLDEDRVVTRELRLNEPYSTALTPPKSVYVMPAKPFSGVWYARPNGAIDPILKQPSFPSGPGLAYGYDMADGGPQAFAPGSVLSVGFTAGLKLWDGTAFVDAGITQLKAFRGSNPDVTMPPENFAITTDVGPFDSLSLAAIAADYDTEAHSSLRFALLGDGTSPTSDSPDGVYLLSMQIRSTQTGVNPSDEYYFVLNKAAPWEAVAAAVRSLAVPSSKQQWVVPEPGACALGLIAIGILGPLGFRKKVSST